ncbi:imidazoleglycerol-phosphate dehydratase HisB [Tannockella kyphosi]|uniref:imidazoleglycerol-phosphate dehydratase HisB n=1 Tax=Tannockella kyphosi TaxID=2899121 RepID=UPI002011E3C1|nr:imidazoleglycerol-phosphate dehydratase HisB [Tannockella kyphosi]
MRASSLKRETLETSIELSLNLDGNGTSNIHTGVGFFDHMLTLLAFHGNFDLEVTCHGDLEVDCHHTVEDIGIALGICMKEALGDKLGIMRYGSFTIPMDEAKVTVDLDISARPYLVYNCDVSLPLLGNYETEMTEEFFRAFSQQAGITLHINKAYGKNTHHIIEAAFKATGRALAIALSNDPTRSNKVISSKGVI